MGIILQSLVGDHIKVTDVIKDNLTCLRWKKSGETLKATREAKPQVKDWQIVDRERYLLINTNLAWLNCI